MPDPSPLRVRTMRRATLLLIALAAVTAALPPVAAAATTDDVVALTTGSFKQVCADGPASVQCTGPSSRIHVWLALIAPLNGPVVSLQTDATIFGAPPLDAESQSWMNALHGLACADEKGAAAFVAKVAGLGKPATVPAETIGPCRMSGSMALDEQGRERYRVVSSIRVQPTPTPTVTPSPSPRPTPTAPPTSKPTAKPTATSTPTAPATPSPPAPPTAAPAPTASPTPAASPTPDPSPSPTLAAVATVSPPTASPALGGDATAPPIPPPTASPTAAPAGGPVADPPGPSWDQSVLGFEEVSGDAGTLGGSLLLALLLLLLIGFIGELFNNTVENNYDEISGWFQRGPIGRVRRALGGVRINPPGRPGVLVFIALTALISSFVDRGFGLNVRSIAVFLGFLVGLIVVLASFKLPPILARRRRTGELGQLRPLPWALAIAALFVLTSRMANLQPGYLYGIVLGAIFLTDATDRDEGRETFWGSIWTLVAAIAAWLALTWLRGLGLPADGFGVTLLQTAFAATLVAGLEAAAFALMPLRFLPGYVLYKWNRRVWAVLWGVSLFAFFHILIGPTSGYVSELSPQGFLAALGVFAAFGALSIGTWLYFRLRNAPVPEPADAG